MFDVAAISLDSIAAFGIDMFVFLLGLAALIFVHELGHFLIARKCGVIVEKFSLGFGPKIVGFKQGGTEYLIAAIPLGGYVKMKGEDPGEELGDTTGSFSHANVYHRIAIAFGGPLFNILFAILIYVIVFMNGVPTLGTTVGMVRDDSPALAAGIETGDRIVEVNGQEIRFWDQLLQIVHDAPGEPMQFVVEKDGKSLVEKTITPVSEEIVNLWGEKETVGLIGITPLVRRIADVEEGSAADKAGIQKGDVLLEINNTPIRGWQDLKTAAMDHPGKQLDVTVLREDGMTYDLKLTPKPEKMKDETGKDITIGQLGVALQGEMEVEQYGIIGSMWRSVEETWKLTYLIAVSVKKMIFGSVSAENIGGPIMIFQFYGQQAEQGFNQIIRLTALLSINLGLINLFPIPILDGGHIMFFLIEILKGKPVSERSRERAAQVGLFMILFLMIFAFYNDIMRIMK
ncbi:putative zinc metalloprotease aq_1964 [Nitrospina gracilis 3/211]|uniref:Zinc metalloprotease n=1 Tax=Nitrospina gracilis (strain 3/211) TaxID=1266370 RepID=M1Z240_NITG3|nr:MULTISPECIES: RIP metalloprotease RseP [Nitrospina]MCF8724791.1 regulator of sigma E protease [Nitrospina sp. Nb-3]CCQ92066.1 putative zinc metalloprotease aq_1964 [Nitrospina gracilis 3/211]